MLLKLKCARHFVVGLIFGKIVIRSLHAREGGGVNVHHAKDRKQRPRRVWNSTGARSTLKNLITLEIAPTRTRQLESELAPTSHACRRGIIRLTFKRATASLIVPI